MPNSSLPAKRAPAAPSPWASARFSKLAKFCLLATGASKAAAVAKSIEGPITSAVSASALQLHPDVTFIIDDAAAAQLTQRDYYLRVLEMTALLTPDRLE